MSRAPGWVCCAQHILDSVRAAAAPEMNRVKDERVSAGLTSNLHQDGTPGSGR